ncbi:MAG TPA: LacI family DNA-binding transcriptional regulator [Pseudolabrys sp.]|jgi:LacI family transcriptional regulator
MKGRVPKPRKAAPSKTAPTIHDVAHRAGVSPATVSNVLGGTRGVRSDSRALVIQAAAVLGYKSNHMASSLRRGNTRTIGVVVPNLANEFFSALVTHWEAEAAKAGYEILVVASEDDVATEARRIQSVIARRVDGILIAPALDAFGASSGFPKYLPPTVLVDRAFGHQKFDTVSSDNLDAGYVGTRHLIQLGHRDIAVLTSADSHYHLRNRVDGYRKALSEAGLAGRERLVIGGRSVEACRAVIERELRRPDRPTAIFATTFFSTLGTIKAIHSLGIAFPCDISLVAFEHSEWMTAVRPYLTAVAQQSEQLAGQSWRVLMERIARPAAKRQRITIPVHLSIRESARPSP